MARRYDLLIRGAAIVDGTGAPSFPGDVGINADRIVSVGDLSASSADEEVLACGMMLAPGFIDAHTHDDRAILGTPSGMQSKLTQGVTTVVVGNCGISLAPHRMQRQPPAPLDLLGGPESWEFDSFGAYAQRLVRRPPVVNAVALIGNMSLRAAAMAFDFDRAATDLECARMRDRLAAALDEGASGFSTGLWYPPSRHAPTQEILAVAEALRESQGLYVTHLRDESHNVIASIEEALGIGRQTGAAVVVSHHKCALPENFGRSRETLAHIDAASATQEIAFDVYPYAATSTALLPQILRDDFEVRISWSAPHPEAAGRMLSEIAREWGVDNQAAARRLIPASAIYFSLDEADVRRIVAHPKSMIGSDGLPHDDRPHPRLWGTFPRVLGHYARELGLFSMEMAVHKMTGRTAEVFGLVDRGSIREGAYADLVMFDPENVRDRATFESPTLPAEGILRTWVNGEQCYVQGEDLKSPAAGRLLTRRRR
jgi:N-acyl-D-amino-acid deacylase